MKAESFSKQGLERLHRVLSGHIHRGHVPGLVALVSCRDDVHIHRLLDTGVWGDGMERERCYLQPNHLLSCRGALRPGKGRR